ncbi:hypothetical protein T261_7608 [Streptomyces lydicus]|nr:hypothetical protein T261_7608 [Streptomyces lydicus]
MTGNQAAPYPRTHRIPRILRTGSTGAPCLFASAGRRLPILLPTLLPSCFRPACVLFSST